MLDLEIIEHKNAISEIIRDLIAEVRELRAERETGIEKASEWDSVTAEAIRLMKADLTACRAMLERIYSSLKGSAHLWDTEVRRLLPELANLIEGGTGGYPNCPTCGSTLKLTCSDCGEGMDL